MRSSCFILSVTSRKSESDGESVSLAMVTRKINSGVTYTMISLITGSDDSFSHRGRLSGSRLLVGLLPLQALQPQVLGLCGLLQRVPGQAVSAGQVRRGRADRPQLIWLHCRPVNVDSGYTTPTNCDNNNSNKNINILMNGTQSKPATTGPSKLERTKLSCTGTLQKVKRVYLWPGYTPDQRSLSWN